MVRPRPSDITTEGVSAPGLWILPTARRRTADRRRGARRASAITATETPLRRMNAPTAAAMKIAAIRRSNAKPIARAISKATVAATIRR